MVKKSTMIVVIIALLAFGVCTCWGYTVTKWPVPGIPNTTFGPGSDMPGPGGYGPYGPGPYGAYGGFGGYGGYGYPGYYGGQYGGFGSGYYGQGWGR
jgi:hypothetical protein